MPLCLVLVVITVTTITTGTTADLCPKPDVPNGVVSGDKEENTFFGRITCNLGYHLVGASNTVKCRDGAWSHDELPVCVCKMSF